jgi:aspartyl protease family protein
MRMFVIAVLAFGALVGLLAPGEPRPETESTPSAPQRDVSFKPAAPQAAVMASSGETVLTRAGDGHFYADVLVNGRTIRFLVDTGASGVALTRDDAMRAGVSFDPGRFEVVGTGASGPVRGQRVRIADMRLDLKQASDVDGAVLDDGLSVSLLGQSFLSRIGSVSIEADRMTLR